MLNTCARLTGVQIGNNQPTIFYAGDTVGLGTTLTCLAELTMFVKLERWIFAALSSTHASKPGTLLQPRPN